MAYQAITAVTPTSGYDGFNTFDPSDEGEISRIAERNPGLAEDPVNEYEQSFITELGLDAEFFESD
jgi:hypothetical protein